MITIQYFNKVCFIAILIFCSTVHSQESEDVEKVGNGSSLTDETEEQQSEDLAIIGPNGAPIIASQVPVGVTPIGAPVVPVRPLQPAPVLAVEPRPRRKGLLLRALLRERPGLLRRLLRRQRRKKLRPIDLLPTVPGQEGVVPLREDSFEGSYVAVSGRPGQRTLHVVNGKDSFSGQSVQGAVVAGPGDSGHSPNANVGGGDYDYVFDLDNDGSADFYDGPLGARPAVPGFEPLGEPRPGLITRGRDKIGFSPLPRCTYVNTDFYGDDVGDGKGISSGSATGCKEACAELDLCQFWTYREGWARDCYLKQGRRGDPTGVNAVPKVGYVSGTKGDICVCLPNSSNSEEEVCPISYSRPIYPWKPRKNKNRGRGRNGGRCTDSTGAIIPCANDASCFDENGIRIPGCIGNRGRGRGNDGGDDGGVYRYDYDDFDLKPATSTTTGIGRGRCVDANGVIVSCNDPTAIDSGLLGAETATARPGGRRQRPLIEADSVKLTLTTTTPPPTESEEEIVGEDL